MANWCSTEITFYSKNKGQVDAMLKRFLEIINGKPTAKNGFGQGWMGDFANTFFPNFGHEKIDCRGYVTSTDDEPRNAGCYRAFTITTETAWDAKIGMWYKIVQDFYPDVSIAYIAMEPGCDYFCKWDDTEGKIFYPFSFHIDCCFPLNKGDYVVEHFVTKDDLLKYLDEHLPFAFHHSYDLDVLQEEISDKFDEWNENCGDECYINIYGFSEFNPSGFDLLQSQQICGTL